MNRRLVGTKEHCYTVYLCRNKGTLNKYCSREDFSIIFITSGCSYFSASGGKISDFFSNFLQIDGNFLNIERLYIGCMSFISGSNFYELFKKHQNPSI